MLPVYTVNAIRSWIYVNLEPYESMWANHTRLYVRGMDQRTTSPAESLHASMKTGHNRVFAGMRLDVSANTMMNKAQKKGKQISNFNADRVSRIKNWTECPTLQQLTDWAAIKADKLKQLSADLKVWCKSSKLLLVFKIYSPDVVTWDEVTSFARVRYVRIVRNRFAFCSCGLPARSVYPCQHIMACIKHIHIEMYSICWHNYYAHFFLRKGNETISRIFRDMEKEEDDRNIVEGEHILVHNLLKEKKLQVWLIFKTITSQLKLKMNMLLKLIFGPNLDVLL